MAGRTGLEPARNRSKSLILLTFDAREFVADLWPAALSGGSGAHPWRGTVRRPGGAPANPARVPDLAGSRPDAGRTGPGLPHQGIEGKVVAMNIAPREELDRRLRELDAQPRASRG